MDSQSKQKTQAYSKKDVVFALSIFALSVVLHIVMPPFIRTHEVLQRSPLVWVLLWLPVIVAIFVATFLKNRNFVLIGIHRRKFGHSLLTGFIFGLIPVGSMIILGFIRGWELNTPENMLFSLMPILVNAASEDILFVGFIQTRLSGVFKGGRKAIYIGSALFPLHICRQE